MNFIQKYFANREVKRRAALRSRLARDLMYFRENDNRGLLQKRLYNMPGVSRLDMSYGGLRFASVEVTMNDGYEIYVGREVFVEKAMRKAARRVAKRLKETRLSV